MKRVDRNVFKWFGHVERMGKDRIGKKVIRVCMEENRSSEVRREEGHMVKPLTQTQAVDALVGDDEQNNKK